MAGVLAPGRELRAGRRRRFAGELQLHEQAVDMAARADALHDFLPQVAALGEVDAVQLAGFLRQVGVRDVLAVAGASLLDAHGAPGIRARLRVLPRRAMNSAFRAAGTNRRKPGEAGGADARDHGVFPRRVRVIRLRHGRLKPGEHFRGARTFEAERGERRFLERHLVRHDIPPHVLRHALARFRFGIEQKAVRQAEDVHIGLDAALRVEQEGVAAPAGRELLDVVAGEVVQEPDAVAAGGENLAPAGEIDPRGAVSQRFVTLGHTFKIPAAG